MLPVAQMAPPTITRGQNFGLFRMMFTTKETVPAQYGEQKINENLLSTLSLFNVLNHLLP